MIRTHSSPQCSARAVRGSRVGGTELSLLILSLPTLLFFTSLGNESCARQAVLQHRNGDRDALGRVWHIRATLRQSIGILRGIGSPRIATWPPSPPTFVCGPGRMLLEAGI